MKKITYSELKKIFREHEASNEKKEKHLTAHIIFTEDSFEVPYSLESRTYAISSNNKAFISNMCGYSIFGNCIDGSDPCVRLDAYMKDENGRENGWKVDYCYLV